jgi:hypothetical protein
MFIVVTHSHHLDEFFAKNFSKFSQILHQENQILHQENQILHQENQIFPTLLSRRKMQGLNFELAIV